MDEMGIERLGWGVCYTLCFSVVITLQAAFGGTRSKEPGGVTQEYY